MQRNVKIIILLIGGLFSCKNSNRDSKVEKCSYKLAAFENTSTIELPFKMQGNSNDEIEFSENLIQQIDSTLIHKNVSLKISTEKVILCTNDTIQVSVYDIINTDPIKTFDSFEVFVGIFKMPIKCLVFSCQENYCAVCKRGLTFEENFEKEKLIEYLRNGKQQRLEQR